MPESGQYYKAMTRIEERLHQLATQLEKQSLEARQREIKQHEDALLGVRQSAEMDATVRQIAQQLGDVLEAQREFATSIVDIKTRLARIEGGPPPPSGVPEAPEAKARTTLWVALTGAVVTVTGAIAALFSR